MEFILILNPTELVRVFRYQPKQLAAVAVPIYKSELNEYEVTSLSQCLKVFAKHPIVFYFPENLDLSYYKNFCSEHHNIIWKVFDNAYFGSGEKNNILMLSSLFYNSFLDYKYILIHHLDAFVFRDELEQWCNANYDYVGSPWPTAINPPKISRAIGMAGEIYSFFADEGIFVGNGGFSLRNVQKHILALKIFSKQAKSWHTWNSSSEDCFWASLKYFYPLFKIPSKEIAASFAFEEEPEQWYKINGNKLPFGCHGWEKFDIDFWRPFFADQGFII